MKLIIVTGDFDKSVMTRDFYTTFCSWMPVYDRPGSEQSKFGFDAFMNMGGIPRAIFTQSENILNGARKAKVFNPLLDVELEGRLYINNVLANTLVFNRYGSADNWPKGFFDQMEDDLCAILKEVVNVRKAANLDKSK